MEVHRSLNSLPKFKNAVITIGTFDGVHQGHRQLLDSLILLANKNQGESVLITFHPHPRFIINPKDTSLKLINTLDEKIDLVAQSGIDHLVIVPFDRDFSNLSAEAYIEDFLWKHFEPKTIVIGYDHRFGKGRKGSITLLNEYQKKYHFELKEIAKHELENIAISSTKIRKALLAGEIDEANKLMKHPYQIKGIVTKGNQLGRTIGFPTANIILEDKHKLIPPNGAYAVKVIVEKKEYLGMLNIGVKPTIKNNTKKTIEVNIFDFNKDIYDKRITIKLILALRKEMKFDNLEQLKNQLAEDRKKVKKLLKNG